MVSRRFNIMIVDDSEEDIELMQQALLESEIPVSLTIAKNGESALAQLQGTESAMPDLVLLDLNMPKINGHQVLRAIKQDEALKRIPVIIMTTSRSPDDIQSCYYEQSNCYICKPQEFEHYYQAVETVKDFWLRIVKLPLTTARYDQ